MVLDPSKQLAGAVDTANEVFFDAMLRHQIGLMNLSGSIRNEVWRILDATEQDMADKIRSRLAGKRGLNTPADVARMQTLIKQVNAIRLPAWEAVTAEWLQQVKDLSRSEPTFTDGILKTSVPAVLNTTLPPVPLLDAIARTYPFEGKTMRQWSRSIARTDLNRIDEQIKIGMVQGESSQAIARRVVGTARLNGKDGVTEITRRDAAGITRTAVNAISNRARREYYRGNNNLFSGELYTATLDNRTCWSPTSLVTMADGTLRPIGEVEVGDAVMTGVSGRPALVNGKFTSLVETTVAIYCDGEYVGDTTHGHKILTQEGWETAGRLCLSSDIPKRKVLCRSVSQPEETVDRSRQRTTPGGHGGDVSRGKGCQKCEDVCCHEGSLAGSRIQGPSRGDAGQARSAQEDVAGRSEGNGSNNGGWTPEEEFSCKEIGQREMVSEKGIRGQEQNRSTEIVSLSIDGDDHTYIVGGIIVHNTAICMSLDGQVFPVAEGPIPPLHFNCRSIRVGVIDRTAIGRRPARPFAERELTKEFSKKQGLAKQFTSRASLPRGQKGPYDQFASKRMRELTGTVPAKVSYQEWLGRQSVGFQNDVLGETKGRLFRKGGLKLTKFVDRAGNELTLSQLASTDAAAFRAAGLNPENFL